MKKAKLFLTALCVVCLNLIGLSVAQAEIAETPSDVQTWFQESAVQAVQRSDTERGSVLSFTSVQIGEPVQVVRPTVEGGFESMDEWTAPILQSDRPVGTITAWRNPETDAVELAFYDDAARVAEAVIEISADADSVLLVDPFGDGRAAANGDVIESLELPVRQVSASVTDYFDALAAQEAAANAAPMEGEGGGGGTFAVLLHDSRPVPPVSVDVVVACGVVAIAAAVGAFSWRRRKRV